MFSKTDIKTQRGWVFVGDICDEKKAETSAMLLRSVRTCLGETVRQRVRGCVIFLCCLRYTVCLSVFGSLLSQRGSLSPIHLESDGSQPTPPLKLAC
jgi:hypothetical protein